MGRTARWEAAENAFRRWLMTGTALLVPLIVTLLVVSLALNFISQSLDPIVTAVRVAPGISPIVEGFLVELIAVAGLLVVIVTVGAVAEVTEESYAGTFHAVIEAVPGVGELYRSFRRMSDVMVEGDTDAFREVKLVEYPEKGAYTLAFVTASTPEKIREVAGQIEMHTLFVPMAPNPVMGGFLVHLSPDRVYDIDLTVEEAVESIVTSGVSVGAADHDRDRPLSMAELGDMDMDPIDESFDGNGNGHERIENR